jgi:hypothetical protein
VRIARLAGLFVFEFVVVLLGVLAAQAVAEWASNRRVGRAADAQMRYAVEQATEVARVQRHWARVGACLSERARNVARAASDGQTLAASAIGRPALPFREMPTWDDEVRRAAVVRFGQARMDAIGYFENRAQVIAETSRRIRDAWATFKLLDPVIGVPSAVDRGNVRVAAISALDHIRLLGYDDPAEWMDALGVPRSEWESGDVGTQIDDCGLIHNWR